MIVSNFNNYKIKKYTLIVIKTRKTLFHYEMTQKEGRHFFY